MCCNFNEKRQALFIKIKQTVTAERTDRQTVELKLRTFVESRNLDAHERQVKSKIVSIHTYMMCIYFILCFLSRI